MKHLIFTLFFIIGSFAHGNFEPPSHAVYVCVEDCKFGVPQKQSNGDWKIVKQDVEGFSFHAVSFLQKDGNIPFSFYAKPIGLNVSVSTIYEANRSPFDYYLYESLSGKKVGSFTYYGELNYEYQGNQCSLKFSSEKNGFLANCSNSNTGEFDFSGLLKMTQRDLP